MADEPLSATVRLPDISETDTVAPQAWNSWLLAEGQYLPRGGVGYDLGRGIGYPDSYGHASAMIPWLERPSEFLLFSDLRLLLDNDAHPGSNLGLGCRYYATGLDRTFGTAVYYDLRETELKAFQQLTVSFDTLGSWWDLRTNVYFQSLFCDQAATPPMHFSGTSLWLPGEDQALSGFDLEVMVPLPTWGSFDPRVGAGCYHLQGGETRLWGWKARAETRVGEDLSVDLSVNRDEQFGTTVNLGATLWLPNLWGQRSGKTSGRRVPSRRLGEPVQRSENIAILSQPAVLASEPLTGQPYQFLHVASASAAGNGSLEAPYSSLAAALQDPRYQSGAPSIIYVHTSGDTPLAYTGDLTLAPHSQLRSTSPVQYLATQRGSVKLPFSGTDPTLSDLPQISGLVILSSNSSLMGFDITGSVQGSNVSNVTIAENCIHDPNPSSPEGISLYRAAGTVTIQHNQVSNCQGSFSANGISLSEPQGATVTICQNTIQNCQRGILLYEGELTGRIDENTITGSQEVGLRVMSNTKFSGSIDHNSICGNYDGILIQGCDWPEYSSPTLFAGTISHNRLCNNTIDGLRLESVDFTGEINGNTISGNGHNGIAGNFETEFPATGHEKFNGTIRDNVMEDNGWSGITFVYSTADLNHHMALLNNQFSNNGSPGYYCDVSIKQVSGNGALYVDFDGNTSSTSPLPGTEYHNYQFSRTNYASSSCHHYLHLGTNTGTVGTWDLTLMAEPWVDWPHWPE